MALKRICDRCSYEINPINSGKRLELGDVDNLYQDQMKTIRELCVSCSMGLLEWLNKDPRAEDPIEF